MPAPGDQHSVIVNPFEEPKKRVSEYTAQEIATLQSRLEKQLGPEYISSRAGPSGQKVHYIAAEKCIALANEVFGFNGWSSSIQNIQVDFVDEHPQTLKISLGLSVIVRVTLRDGTFHEDIGYGHIENCKGKAAAFEKAKKEGTTDALKRALRNFGNVLGNCIYDKAYLAKVTKLKVGPTKFDADGLHRHSDYAVKREPKEMDNGALVAPPHVRSEESFEDFLGELDEADFNITEEGHPDEVVLPQVAQTSSSERSLVHTVQNSPNKRPRPQSANNAPPMQPPARPLIRSGSGGHNNMRPPQTPHHQPPSFPSSGNSFQGAQNNMSNNGSHPIPQQQQQQRFNQNRPAVHHSNMNQNPQAQMTPPTQPAGGVQPAGAAAPPAGEAVGFFSARAVKEISEDVLVNGQVAPKAGQVFNPKAESPSIRKTPGIDHTKSKPLSRTGQHVPPSSTSADVATDPVVSAPGPSMGMSRPGSGVGAGAPMMGAPRGGAGAGGVVNPQFDQTRRIGAPGASSPLANRGQYRPPTIMKRPALATCGADAPARAPLADVSSNAPINGGTGGGGLSGPDAKRQKMG
ncbi:double strand break repair protein mus-11 [Apodospora peruviana]|uniref:RAD52 homolog n=1 Tax=Apodospora peruviana TaxID=516989 RepID=A0AAE0IKG0_9PEZI|nr:double strand break repair protein mus-11 [Apodospora peruviana]